VTLNLTLNNSSTGMDTQTACDTFTWIDGLTYTSNNNTATHILVGGNVVGCDSVVTLNLTLGAVDTAVIQIDDALIASQGGATYQWIDCGNGNAALPGETNQSFTAASNGDYAVISTPGFSNNIGRASVYYYNGTNWILQAHLFASDSTTTMNFGTSVSISGDYVVVGAPKSKTNNIPQGAVYLYQKPTNGWGNATETAKLVASDGATDDHFGFSISISGNDLVIGANRADDLGNRSGSAYVFTKPLTGWINGTETAKLLPSDGTTEDTFGSKVDIDGASIVIGSPNAFGSGGGNTKKYPNLHLN